MTSIALDPSRARVLETVTRVTPFGIAFRDAAGGVLVSEGLQVRLSRLAGDRGLETREALPNRAGVFVADRLPGMREFETGPGNAEFWARGWPTSPFLVEVRDALGRFLPVALRVALPLSAPGPVVPPCIAELSGDSSTSSSPAPPSIFVPLFSAAARAVPAGMASVRATLVDAPMDAPAAFALLEVRQRGHVLARGIADERGEVLVPLAWPEPSSFTAVGSSPGSPPDSPPSGPPRMAPLGEQFWSIEIGVRYRRALARYGSDPARAPLPELCELAMQPPAPIETAGSPPEPLGEETLKYGEELIVAKNAGGTLLITPA